jgi:hypothetical protein
MNRMLTAAFAASVLVAAAASASAETLEATWTFVPDGGSTTTLATWEQDSEPTPLGYVTGEATVVPVWDFVAYAPVGSLTAIVYYTSSFLPVTFSTALLGGVFVAGPQAYAGSEAAPQFAPGSFSGLLQGELPSTLTFTAVPETSTWVMMLAGFAGLGALSFRVRRRGALIR